MFANLLYLVISCAGAARKSWLVEHIEERHPRADIGMPPGPTPLQPMRRLTEYLPGDTSLLVKRDDYTGVGLGGNKVRHLEWYFGAAQAAHASVILITGSVQSNYVRMAAAAAAHLGMDIIIQSEKRVKTDSATYAKNGNFLITKLMGAHLVPFDDGENEGSADANALFG